MERILDNRATLNQTNTSVTSALLTSEDTLGDTEEPPDERLNLTPKAKRAQPMAVSHDFGKMTLQTLQRHSLLTQALLSSDDDEDEARIGLDMTRGPSVSSSFSRASGASIADMTSDGGLTSPGARTNSPSPPPPSTMQRLPITLGKPFTGNVVIGQDDGRAAPPLAVQENNVEANLGRKRCIKFACGKRETPAAKPSPPKEPATVEPAPPRRRCLLKFVCPGRSTEAATNGEQPKPRRGRLSSPPPPQSSRDRRPSATLTQNRKHRDSDTTLCNGSPQSPNLRRSDAKSSRLSTEESDLSRREATRFHEFASSEDEDDEWVRRSTVPKDRLTVDDTLKIENKLRRTCQEAEEEAIEEDGADSDEDVAGEDDNDDDDDDDDDEDDDDEQLDDGSDDGFDSDDEKGFAGSDDDDSDAGSDFQWWAPVKPGASARHSQLHPGTHLLSASGSSVASLEVSPHRRLRHRSQPMDIRPDSPELPDSTDFVCGTLDEDRPLEDAYMSCLERRRAAKHKATPQDIDPTFPESDPELEDDDDEEDDEPAGHHASKVDESEPMFPHDGPSSHDEGKLPQRGRPVYNAASRKSTGLSPRRLRSPPPQPSKASSRRSTITHHRSPPPPLSRRSTNTRRPSPTPKHRNNLIRSPHSTTQVPSSTATQLTSLAVSPHRKFASLALPSRPVTEAASLPRPLTGFTLHLAEQGLGHNDDDQDTICGAPMTPLATAPKHKARGRMRSRGAIDIVKGLEQKRARRKEMMKQHCKKQNQHHHKDKKPLVPGRGAERMRSIGIEAYKGKKGVVEPVWCAREGFVLSC